MEVEGSPGDMTVQSRLSNSTESIDSMKALTAAIDAANAQVSSLISFQFNAAPFTRACTQSVSMAALSEPNYNFYMYKFVSHSNIGWKEYVY